ncbi:GntR family transcriptional regulator [Geosporobacter ferrireducens]|uniref:GntR family transcriptional regulator n=1 Tax=Geosporobacter ferrireducens TaxID=1424294 RepID=UPI00139C42FC|nr:GntR family transcriptional regulator [Geosporobacter ferrireducens]MTI54464.1 GntR family transcriptional regulator [Geosporobacter ferrireducens]
MLDRNDVIPLYKQLQETLKKQIQSGERKPREKIPSEINLAKEFDVSIITARKAVNLLAEEGFVEKKQGKGTFVAAQKYTRNLSDVISFSEVCRLNGTVAGSQLLESKFIEADKKTLDRLERPEGEMVLYIERLRFVDNEPIVIEKNIFSIAYSFLINEDLDNNSMFDILKRRSGTEVARSSRTIEICRATQQEAQLLKITKGSPLLLIKSIAYSTENKPVFIGTQIINGERYQFTM